MLRWWLGTGIPALLLVGAGLTAQPTNVPPCKIAAKLRALSEGTLPDFTGCQMADAGRALIQADYRPVARIDEAATGIPPSTITSQKHDGRDVYLLYATGKGYPPDAATPVDVATPVASPEPVRFSLEAPREAAEGSSFTLTIRRDKSDRQPHVLGLAYQPAGLLDQPPPIFTFTGKDNSATIQLQTVPGVPGDGNKALVIAITGTDEGAALGMPQRLRVSITDGRPAQSFTVTTSGELRRDAPITFAVTRTDAADPLNPTYDLSQDGKLLQTGQSVQFGDGEPSWTTQLGPNKFDPCGGPVTFILHSSGPDQPLAAAFADGPPASCRPTPPELDDGWSWPVIAAIIAAVLVIGYGLTKWLWPKPMIRTRWAIAWPTIAPFALGERALRWPGASAQARIDPGATHIPNPLPVETDEHG